MVSFKGAHFERDIILTCVRWYLAYPLSYRQLEELMQERGVSVDHSTINRWVVKYGPELEAAFHRRKRPVWLSWRMDETYIKVKGRWYYLYRAVDKASDLSKIQELELWGGLQEPRRMLTPIASGVVFKIFENQVRIA
jgi:transposase-like protein